jgi:hypothetical protein
MPWWGTLAGAGLHRGKSRKTKRLRKADSTPHHSKLQQQRPNQKQQVAAEDRRQNTERLSWAKLVLRAMDRGSRLPGHRSLDLKTNSTQEKIHTKHRPGPTQQKSQNLAVAQHRAIQKQFLAEENFWHCRERWLWTGSERTGSSKPKPRVQLWQRKYQAANQGAHSALCSR